MGYGRLVRFGSTESLPSVSELSVTNDPKKPNSTTANRSHRLLFIATLAILFLVASAVSVAVLVRAKRRSGESTLRKPTLAISQTCSLTQYPSLCINSLLDFPGSIDAGREELVRMSVNVTLQHVGRAFYGARAIANLEMDGMFRSAYEDCLELLDSSVEHLTRSLAFVSPALEKERERSKPEEEEEDVLTWLSAALSNQDTCSEGLDDVPDGPMKDDIKSRLKDLSELVSNSLAIFALSKTSGFSDIPIQNKRRKLLATPAALDQQINTVVHDGDDASFPSWLSSKERRLLQTPASDIQADFVVSKDGNGTYKTIGEAVEAAPEHSRRRIIIYIKAGKYVEDIKISRKKTNIMLIGDGKDNTIIGSSKSVFDHVTTFRTATFAATGAGFIARDVSFENWAGPEKHQAVALRVGADHSVVYRCKIVGYQDSLYVHSLRQFYRECDIYGTVDFIFGNAAVVLQNCNIYARKPMGSQECTITAQNRKDPNQNTGISIHNCRILPAADLVPVKGQYPTYLGRPWKMYSRVVVMLSYIGDHVNPSGWLEWNGKFALDTLYYAEYRNNGPGSGTGGRVNWSGYRVIELSEEASKFTVGQFIVGNSWLPSTGVAFVTGLFE